MDNQMSMTEIRHKLRNQINNITMNAELVKLQVQQDIAPEVLLVAIERILRECKDCGEFINDWSSDTNR